MVKERLFEGRLGYSHYVPGQLSVFFFEDVLIFSSFSPVKFAPPSNKTSFKHRNALVP